MVSFEDDSIKGWQLIWSGHKQKHEHGIGILLAPHVKVEEYTEHLPARILSAKVSVKGLRLAIITVYSPTDATKSISSKSLFYRSLNKAKVAMDKNPRYKVVTLGDFDATISTTSKKSGAWDTVLVPNNPDRIEQDDDGERMLTWCLQNKMKIINSWFRSKRIHRETWRHAATRKWKRIDYICTTPWMEKFITSCRVYTKASIPFDTDHRLLVMNINFPSSKRALKHHLSRTKNGEPKATIDFRALRDDPEMRKQLTMKLDAGLATLHNDMDLLNEQIVDMV